uniref:Cadherin N-terminal domain-containing protein n=1 Tax=Cynoglossus semilaevis TaxID=244447 RepID=A0A3P8V9L5_CYNSE
MTQALAQLTGGRCVPVFICLFAMMNTGTSVTHYSVPEEMEEGSVVANLATDLGLDVQTLSGRQMRIDVVANKKYLDINRSTGELYISERIDRELLFLSVQVSPVPLLHNVELSCLCFTWMTTWWKVNSCPSSPQST